MDPGLRRDDSVGGWTRVPETLDWYRAAVRCRGFFRPVRTLIWLIDVVVVCGAYLVGIGQELHIDLELLDQRFNLLLSDLPAYDQAVASALR